MGMLIIIIFIIEAILFFGLCYILFRILRALGRQIRKLFSKTAKAKVALGQPPVEEDVLLLPAGYPTCQQMFADQPTENATHGLTDEATSPPTPWELYTAGKLPKIIILKLPPIADPQSDEGAEEDDKTQPLSNLNPDDEADTGQFE